MRAVVAHPPGANVRDVRQALLGAGFSCLAEDCVEWDELPPRVARGDADLLVMQTDSNAHANWDALREARQLTSAPAIAARPRDGQESLLKSKLPCTAALAAGFRRRAFCGAGSLAGLACLFTWDLDRGFGTGG